MSNSAICTFAADRTLGKLTKWLRILGFDTIFESDFSSEWFYDHLEPSRILLTRTEKIHKQFAAHRQVFIESNVLFEQLVQIIDELAMTIDDICPFSRCIKCNTPKIDVDKESVNGLVPDYIWETHDSFHMCRQCDRIYWAGSHTERTREKIGQLFGLKNEENI